MTASENRSEGTSRDVERLARGAAIQVGGKLAGRGVGFLLQQALARLLSPAAYGLYGTGFTIYLLAGLLASLGLEHGATRFASRHFGEDHDRLGAVLRRALKLSFGSSLALGALLFYAAPFLATQVFDKPALAPVLAGFALGLPLVACLRVAAAGLRVSQDMRHSALTEDLLQPFSNVALVALVWLIGWRLLGAVGATVTSYGIGFLTATVCLTRVFPIRRGRQQSATDSELSTRELLTFSIPTSLAGLLGFATIWTDRLLVAYLLPEAETGIYMTVSNFALVFSLLLTAFNAVFAPMIAELHQKGEMERLGELFRLSTRWGLYLAIPLFLVLMFFPSELILVLPGREYLSGTSAMLVLACGQMVNLATGSVGFLLVMSGRQNRWLLLAAVALLTNAILNLLWIPQYGILGAAYASAVAMVLLFSGALANVWTTLRLWPYNRRFWKGLVAGLAATAALALIRWADALPPFATLAVAGIVAAGVFGLSLVFLGFEDEDRELLRLLRRRTG